MAFLLENGEAFDAEEKPAEHMLDVVAWEFFREGDDVARPVGNMDEEFVAVWWPLPVSPLPRPNGWHVDAPVGFDAAETLDFTDTPFNPFFDLRD